MNSNIKIKHIGIGVFFIALLVIAGWANFSSVKVAKAAAPTLLQLKYMDSGAGDGRVDLIRLMFSAAITSCTATVADFGYTANDITGSAIAGGTVRCAGDDLYVWIDLGTQGAANITSHTTAPTLTYTDDAARTISSAGGEVANFGPQDISDGTGPWTTAISLQDNSGDGIADRAVFTYSEPMVDHAAGTYGYDATSAANHGSCTGESADPDGTAVIVVTFTCTNVYTAVGDFSITATGANELHDAASNELNNKTFTSASSVPVTDGMKPRITTAATGDTNSDGSVDSLVLTFSEQVDVTDGGTDNDFTLAASSGTATITAGTYTAANTTTLTYTITTSVTGDTSLTVSPSYSTGGAGSIIDNGSNEMLELETVVGTDGAKPIIKQFTYQDTSGDGNIDAFLATFSETVTGDSFLSSNDLNLTNTAGIAMMGFGSGGSDVITGSVSSATVTVGSPGSTANTANGLAFAISTQNGFSLTDGTNTNTTLGAQSQATFVDGAAPQMTIFQYKDSDADGKIDSFTISISESVTASSVLKASNLTFTNVGDFTGTAFGSSSTDLITDTLSSVNVTLETESTVVDTVNTGTIAISTQGAGFSLIDSVGNTNNSNTAQSQLTFADGAGPVITSAVMSDAALNDGKIDKIALTYSENLDMMPGAGTNGFVISSAANHGACGDASSDPDGTTTLNVTFSCANVYTAVGDLTITFTANSNIRDSSSNAPSATLTSSSTTPAAITDGAKPILVSVVKSQNPISAKDQLVLVYSEPMYIDLNSGMGDTAGVIDAGDITSNESMTSTAGIGGIVNGTTLTQIGTFGTDGTVVQSAATNNTVAVSSSTITITLNTATGSYFTTSGTAPSGTFTPTDTVTAPCILAQAPSATTATQRLNSSASAPTSSGSWDLTPPDQITGFSTGTTGNGNIPLLWSAITAPSDFQGFHVYYKTSAAVTYSNGTLWSSTNDTALRTATTTGTDVTDLTVGDLYYFIIHVIDKAGNFSTASSEISANAVFVPIVNVNGGGAPPDLLPPSPPSGQKVEYKNGKIVLTWVDPNVSDLSSITISKGNIETSMTLIPGFTLRGVQSYTDSDVKPGDILKYIIYATDINGNRSYSTEVLAITIPEATITPNTTQVQTHLTTEEKKLVDEQVALIQKSITMIDKVLGLYNVQIKKLSINKTRNKTKIAQIKSVMRRIEKNKAKQILKLNELRAKLEVK